MIFHSKIAVSFYFFNSIIIISSFLGTSKLFSNMFYKVLIKYIPILPNFFITIVYGVLSVILLTAFV
jgi:hypothetical protein